MARTGQARCRRDLLAPTYGRFTEGFDTPVLKEAKALLDEKRQALVAWALWLEEIIAGRKGKDRKVVPLRPA
jgi:hypothetical protein